MVNDHLIYRNQLVGWC